MDLLFRRQYIIGAHFCDKFPNWKRVRISEKLFLTVHPDLEFSMLSNNGISLSLLGFILDPYHTTDGNSDILSTILKKSKSFKDVLNTVSDFGGRFVIIYQGDEGIRLFHDPAGYRQIFYYKTEDEVWAASQPHLIAQELDVQFSRDQKLIDFLDSEVYKSGKTEHAWPGDSTIYNGIKHLLPNHYLDFESCSSVRYWPNNSISELSVNEAVLISSEILQGLLKSAQRRYKLALAVTAGWDTRVLLAASKTIRKDVYFFVQKLKGMSKRHNDIMIPQKLLSKLGLKFNVIEFEKKIDEEFLKIFSTNVSSYHSDDKIHEHYSYFKNLQSFVKVGGSVSEIARLIPRWSYFPGVISAETLAMFHSYKGNAFVIDSCSHWLAEAAPLASKYNLNIVSLSYWEQRMGNWGAMFLSANDIGIEEFHPFNCRKLLVTLLSVDRRYRIEPDCLFYRKLMEYMWPDVLNVPINPGSFKDRVKARLKRILEPSKDN